MDGTIEGSDNQTIRITKIHIDFSVEIPPGTRETAERALRVYPAGCPAHESVKDAITVTHSATFTEV